MIVPISKKISQKINLSYRKKNKPANVLSFRYGQDYGEILVCPEVVRHEAKKQGNSMKYQFAWMVLHGILHLAGMHHEKSSAVARKVDRIEGVVLRKLTVK